MSNDKLFANRCGSSLDATADAISNYQSFSMSISQVYTNDDMAHKAHSVADELVEQVCAGFSVARLFLYHYHLTHMNECMSVYTFSPKDANSDTNTKPAQTCSTSSSATEWAFVGHVVVGVYLADAHRE